MAIVDVLIIGAGPAGAITAFTLAQSGLKVKILEKSSFPRQKPCGGGLSHRAYREIPFNIDPLIHQTITWGYVSVNCRNFTELHGKEPIAYLIDRPAFDALLLQKAIEQGTACHFLQRFLSLNWKNDLITVSTDDRTYQCRYLVGADGVHSRVANQLGLLPDRQTSLAYETRVTHHGERTDPLLTSITFDFGTLLSGYAWLFPKRDHLNIGVFRSWPGRKASKKHLNKFIHNHPSLSQTRLAGMRAYPIPLGIAHDRLHERCALLVGDAANLADPWLGEGLYYALSSGKIAAEAILDHINGISTDLSNYSQKIHQAFSKQFSYARRLSLLINALPDLSLWLLKSSPLLQGRIISLLRGEKTHQEVWRDITAWLPKQLNLRNE